MKAKREYKIERRQREKVIEMERKILLQLRVELVIKLEKKYLRTNLLGLF